MSESIQPDIWNIISFLFGSGIGGTAAASFVNWKMNLVIRKRQEAMEMLQIISKAAPYYNQLAMNSWNLSWDLKKEDRDYKLLMYYMCNVLQFRYKIIQKFGDLQFESLEAERIINEFGRNILSLIIDKVGLVDTSRLCCLVENDLPYHKFHASLSTENEELYKKFEKWLSQEISENDFKQLERTSAWYSQLIMLELNHVYRQWYGDKPSLLSLRPDLTEYLENNERNYFNRIFSFESRYRRLNTKRKIKS